MKKANWVAISVAALTLVACATSPLGRRQLLLMPAAQMDQMGLTAYSQLKQQTPLSTNQAQISYVRCVSNALTATLDGGQTWEINLFEDPTANAFALPGGFMGVHTGLLRVAQNQHQLAAVVGHEIGHVLAQHSNERVSIESATSTGLQLLQVLAGEESPQKQMVFAALGVGAQFGVSMPFSRKHEAEADLIGLEMMAKAGFDPRQAVSLWENMGAAGGKAPPEFMSTHPSNDTRIKGLSGYMPKVLPYYEQALAAGRVPKCS
ncbi:M48 family metallopeptidase [Alcanivorax sp. 1008]|uniref:M48 family metallopeptidase n=1 Tax=Alcanivorax sp. 1008 TaxID=2816853 RepID=UPI001DB8DC92|nr:M48 family metallopeptidase [Alcanivorax sp. 1008]MCC1496418.1 M48 family metallopeptidase [Alcanivorax sp. 1008]